MHSLSYVKAIIFLVLLIYALPCFASGQIPVFHIDVRDKSAVEVGKTLGNAVKKKFPNIEQLYDAHLFNQISQAEFDRWTRQRLEAIAPKLDQAYRDEVLGLTSVMELSSHDQLGDGYLSQNEYWMFLLAPDMGFHIGGSGFGVWGDASRSGYPMIGRNVDWAVSESLRSLQAITVYRDEDKGFVNIGFAGFIGVISGFNQAGLFLAHMDSPLLDKNFTGDYAPGSMVFDIREALETKRRISGALEVFEDIQYAASHSLLLADIYDVQVLEQPPGEDPEVRRDRSSYRVDKPWGNKYQIAAVNCFVLISSPDNCFNMRDNFRWDRFRTLASFSEAQQADPRNMIEIMFDGLHDAQSIYNPRTIQAMVFAPKKRDLHLYTIPVSGVHSQSPRMQQMNGLLSDIPNDAFDWLSTLNLLIFLTLTILIVTLIYGEFIKKKK